MTASVDSPLLPPREERAGERRTVLLTPIVPNYTERPLSPHEPAIVAQNDLLFPALSSRGGEGEDLAAFPVHRSKAGDSFSANSLP